MFKLVCTQLPSITALEKNKVFHVRSTSMDTNLGSYMHLKIRGNIQQKVPEDVQLQINGYLHDLPCYRGGDVYQLLEFSCDTFLDSFKWVSAEPRNWVSSR